MKKEVVSRPRDSDALAQIIPQQKEMDALTRIRLKKLAAFEAPFLEKALLKKGVFASKKEFSNAMREFKRFVALGLIETTTLGVPGEKVDAIWHEFILFPREYTGFCNEIVGSYLHHIPCGDDSPEKVAEAQTFARSYKDAYARAYGVPLASFDSCCGGKNGCGLQKEMSVETATCYSVEPEGGGTSDPDNASCPPGN